MGPALSRPLRPLLRPAASRALLVLVGLGWAALCLALDAAGHAPTRPPLPVDRWYRVQALLVPGLVPAMGALAAGLARRWLGPVAPPTTGPALRVALGLPLGAFIAGDALAWGIFGHAAMAPASALLGAAALVAMLALATALLQGPALPWGRALRVAAGALGLAGLAGSLLLR